MHAILVDHDPDLSHLVFPPVDSSLNSLYMHEIPQLPMEKEMVILSACNTALGSIRNGNGIKGLSYSFYQSGTRSMVSSLWKVPDQATQKIMVQFYHHLKIGKSKSDALKEAKMDYLSSVGSEIEKHPYYWAGFILTGSDTTIEFSNDNLGHPILFILLVFFLCTAMWMTYKRSIK